MQKLIIFGGKTGIGREFATLASKKYEVSVLGRPDYDLTQPDSIKALGEKLASEKPSVFILNAFVRSKDPKVSALQAQALETLWPYLVGLDCTVVVLSSAAIWFNGPTDALNAVYRAAKQQLTWAAVRLGFLKTDEAGRKARMVVFEPATMENRADTAEDRKTTLLTYVDAWAMLEAVIKLKQPFIRIGAQGKTPVEKIK